MTELARLVGIDLVEEPSAMLSLLIDGAYAQRRLLGTHGNRVTLKKAAKIAIDAYAFGLE